MNTLLVYLDAGDRLFSDRLAQWRSPRWFRAWMVAATRLGDGWLWAVLGILLLLGGDWRGFFAASVACALANIVMILLKRRFRRCRPRARAANEFLDLVHADLSSFDNFSFPSGHTINAFAIGTVIASLHPLLLPAMGFTAMSVGASRVVLRMHFVTDVLAGAALGIAIGCAICRCVQG